MRKRGVEGEVKFNLDGPVPQPGVATSARRSDMQVGLSVRGSSLRHEVASVSELSNVKPVELRVG